MIVSFRSDSIPPNDATIRKFLNFVGKLLLYHTSTIIEKLSLKMVLDGSHVYDWILVALTLRGVWQLNLCLLFIHLSINFLLDVLFTCKTLVLFNLDLIGDVLDVPSDVCFAKSQDSPS